MASAELDPVGAACRSAALSAAVDAGLLRVPETIEDKPMALFYDLDAWERNLANIRALFGSHWLHACAAKTNPLFWFLRQEKALGHGAECASIAEVVAALENGFAPENVVFDSPSKTIPEIRYALEKGVHLNMDNLQELDRVVDLLPGLQLGEQQVLGLPLNPLVGAGSIAAFSVSTGKSKFGVPLYPDPKYQAELVQRVTKASFLNCIHVHTGSGGMGLKQLVSGVRAAVDFAKAVNEAAGHQQVRIIDIGGGLSTNFEDDTLTPSFSEYADALRQEVPEIFDASQFERVISEFGASCHIKFGWLASRIEYIKECDGGRIALIHAGSEIFLRSSYCPDTFMKHRVLPFDATGRPKAATDLIPHDIAGPLCFAGDVVVRDAMLPPMDQGDIVMLMDAGGNTLSLHTTHCSRQMPSVFGYRQLPDASFTFETLKGPQLIKDTIGVWRP